MSLQANTDPTDSSKDANPVGTRSLLSGRMAKRKNSVAQSLNQCIVNTFDECFSGNGVLHGDDSEIYQA